MTARLKDTSSHNDSRWKANEAFKLSNKTEERAKPRRKSWFVTVVKTVAPAWLCGLIKGELYRAPIVKEDSRKKKLKRNPHVRCMSKPQTEFIMVYN